MSDNNLIPVRHLLPERIRKEEKEENYAIVSYEKNDSAHYSFFFDFDNGYSYRMNETEQSTDQTDFVDVDFDEEVPESDRVFYAVAAACGILTGTLSMVHLSEEQLKKIEEFKKKDWEKIVIGAGVLSGYKKSDYKGACRFLLSRVERIVKKAGKIEIASTVLAEHPSLTGLAFSIITQFYGKKIVLDETGEISFENLPDDYVIGQTNGQKLICAIFYWLFSLGMTEIRNKISIVENMGIPKELRKAVKNLFKSTILKDIPTDEEEARRMYSGWVRNILGRLEKDVDENIYGKNNPLFSIMKLVLNVAENAFPVLINECLVRGMYVLLYAGRTARERGITSFKELSEISLTEILPEDQHVLSKMCLISSASFTGANLAGATIKALKEKKVNGKKFSDTFISELNVAGIGRFLFACSAASKYWGEDISILFQRGKKRKTQTTEEPDQNFEDNSAFDPLVLDAGQARLLYSLENLSTVYDIKETKKSNNAKNKQLWLDRWKKVILSGIGIPTELAEEYFVTDEDKIYDGIYELAKDHQNWRWFCLLTIELALFEPYKELGCEYDRIFKKLKPETDYVKDQFVRRQTIVSQDEVDSILKEFSRYKGYVSGSTVKKIGGAGATAVAAVAMGTLAMTFAPGIAIAIAGEAVVGLHGAALTSASLAFVGGGSLAAGGLGMAGGTAIITGGGALIGLVGSGTASAAVVLLQTPTEYWLRQSAKLLTFCKCVLIGKLKDKKSVLAVYQQVNVAVEISENELNVLKEEKNDLDKDLIRKTEDYQKYLKKCSKELNKLTK